MALNFLSFLMILLSLNSAFANEVNYYNCMEYQRLAGDVSRLNCQNSEHEYLVDFGFKYCLRFMYAGILVENELGKMGQKYFPDRNKFERYQNFKTWIWGTMKCLQKEITSFVTEESDLTCKKIRDRAFASHRTCYEDNGFCSIDTFWDDIVFKIIGFWEMLSVLPQSTDMLGMCVL